MKSIFHALNRLKVFRGLTEQEFAWVLYDVGNSAFTMLSCSLIPIWFKSLAIGTAPGQINSHQATAYYSIAVAVVTVIVALLGPIFGVLADHKDKKKVLFTTAATLGIFGCILNGFITGWLLFLILFVFTKICYSASLTIYDSMLNDITSEERMDEVSSYGFAWGYIGSCIPFLIALIAYVLGPDMVGVLPDMLSKGIGFTVTAVWWLLVTIPLIRGFKQRNYVETEGHDIRKAFAEIFHTLKNIATHDKKVLFFLIAFFLYIDGVGTIIDNAINIGTDLNLNTVGRLPARNAGRCVRRLARLRKALEKIQHRHAHSRLYCGLFRHRAVRAHAQQSPALRDSGVLHRLLPGLHPVALALVLLQDHPSGKLRRILRYLRYFLKRRVLPRLCGHRSCKACRRHHQRGGGMSRSVLCARLPLPAHCR